jgi:hypothetical protein
MAIIIAVALVVLGRWARSHGHNVVEVLGFGLAALLGLTTIASTVAAFEKANGPPDGTPTATAQPTITHVPSPTSTELMPAPSLSNSPITSDGSHQEQYIYQMQIVDRSQFGQISAGSGSDVQQDGADPVVVQAVERSRPRGFVERAGRGRWRVSEAGRLGLRPRTTHSSSVFSTRIRQRQIRQVCGRRHPASRLVTQARPAGVRVPSRSGLGIHAGRWDEGKSTKSLQLKRRIMTSGCRERK